MSVSSGVAQLASAYPALFAHRVALAITLVLAIMVINLRGVKESGRIFAVPTYFFVFAMFVTLGTAFFRHVTGTLGHVVDPPPLEVHRRRRRVTLFLLLHAFANGTTALTGVEAISNGIPAFKEPRSRNAGITLIWMSCILGALFLGISYLAGPIGAIPSEAETVISQLARTAFDGRGLPYLATIAATTLILVMAANTAYADFPRLSALQAADGFLPRQLTYRGSRLVYSRGIIVLAVVACALIAIFNASVSQLIPLYAIGVFLSFTLSQAGMTRRWWKIGHLAAGGGGPRARLGPAPRPALAPEDGDQRRGRGSHRDRGRGLRGDEVHGGGVDHHHRDPGARLRAARHPPPLPRAGRRAVARGLRGGPARPPPPRAHPDQRRAPRNGRGAPLRERRSPTTSPRCTCPSTRSRRPGCRASGACGATACGWSSSTRPTGCSWSRCSTT